MTTIAEDLPYLQMMDKPCPHYLEDKQSKRKISKVGFTRATQRNEIIHSDLCGPMPSQSLPGSKYFMTFIDDYSRQTWCYSLNENSQDLEIFRQFKAFIENETGLQIKTFRSDSIRPENLRNF